MRLRKHYTIRYEEMIYEQIKKKNIEEIKQEEEIGWGTLESMFEEYAKKKERMGTSRKNKLRRVWQ